MCESSSPEHAGHYFVSSSLLFSTFLSCFLPHFFPPIFSLLSTILPFIPSFSFYISFLSVCLSSLLFFLSFISFLPSFFSSASFFLSFRFLSFTLDLFNYLSIYLSISYHFTEANFTPPLVSCHLPQSLSSFLFLFFRSLSISIYQSISLSYYFTETHFTPPFYSRLLPQNIPLT